MRKFLLLSLFIFGFTRFSSGQTNTAADYRKCILSFYQLLYQRHVDVATLNKVYACGGVNNETELIKCDSLKINYSQPLSLKQTNSPSYLIKVIKRYAQQFTHGLSLPQVTDLISKAKTFNQGDDMADYLQLDFPDGNSVYFALNTDTPIQIVAIYFANGDEFEGKLCVNNHPEKLLFPGTINDADGYVNLREKPDVRSKIVAVFHSNDIFYYVPDSTTDWWPVEKDSRIIGYIHKSRVKNYCNFSAALKQRVHKQLNEDSR